ncbi:hypothetical protein DB88DRAFT_526121 [Papiliotrema laurentii]|uniref:Uncharacterized protein n=1 Tax=Papiliotrema laurentii TaxID=5418 RepID=A0AAD9L684_PAPLA|nr:hypothetical protein DB88DRAFT_526121 [Papiliotrema laurentii]
MEHTMNVSTSFSDKEAAQHLEAASLLKERESHITQMSGLNEELYSIVQSIASCPTGQAPPPDFFRQASANGSVLGYMAGVLLVREECSRKAKREEAIEHYKELFSALEDHDRKVQDNEETYRSLVHSSNGTSNRSTSTMVASMLQGLCTKAQQVGTTIGQATRGPATSLFNTADTTLTNAPVVQSLIFAAAEVPAALRHRDVYPGFKGIPVDVQLAGQGFIPP